MDTFTPQERSKLMSRVHSRNSKPELLVRRVIHSMGYRYRLHDAKLPGKPDIVFASRRKVIFVHGCFWHRHSCAKGQQVPKSHTNFWKSKLEKNKNRDIKQQELLQQLGWDVLVIWECMLRDLHKLQDDIRSFLETSNCK